MMFSSNSLLWFIRGDVMVAFLSIFYMGQEAGKAIIAFSGVRIS